MGNLNQQNRHDPVPPSDYGRNPRSAAAHLDTITKPHTKPAGKTAQRALREPPQFISRIGKQHRGE
jgi:hypothetical protein